jgi:uracil-DNA glycosylase family 4
MTDSTPKYVPGIGPSTATVAIIGEAPGAQEDQEGIPFVGEAGRMLNRILKESGLGRDSCYLTNVVKYRPKGNDFKRVNEGPQTLAASIESLRKEILALNPNVLVPLGNNALEAITGRKGISKYRGSVLQSNFGNFKVVPTIHPAALLYNRDDRNKKEGSEISIQVVIADFMKVEKESHFREIRTIPRKLEIIKDAYSLYSVLESYGSVQEVSIDIETYKGIPVCIALAFSPYHSVSIPLLSIPGLGGGIDITQTELVSIYQLLSRYLNRKDLKFIGQNFKFDHEKLITISGLVDPVLGKLGADTSLMMGLAYSEFKKNLAFMASLFTNEPYWKDEGKEFNPKKDHADRLLLYNAKDAAVTFEIKNALDKELSEFDTLFPGHGVKNFYYNFVNKLHDFYMDIEIEGLDVDKDQFWKIVQNYQSQIVSAQNELNTLVGHEVNVKSPKDIPHLIFTELKLPYRDNLQEDTLVALWGNHTEPGSREATIINKILQLRQLRTNYGFLFTKVKKGSKTYQYPKWDQDGRIRTTYRITGTETGRTSTGTLGPPIRPWASGMAFQTLPKHGPFAKDIRSIFVAPPGYVLLEADLSQAEARIVAILSDDEYTLKLFDTVDIHTETARWIFPSQEEISSDQRFIGKMARHSGNYGTGKRTFMLAVNSLAKKFGLNVQLSEKGAQNILNVFHTRTPKIRGTFQQQVLAEVNATRTLFNPFGRMRQFFGTLKQEEIFAQIPQSTVPDHLRAAGFRIKDRIPGIRICAEQHDALLLKLKEETWKEEAAIVKEELEKPIDFSKCSLPRGKLVIPAECKVGHRYSELEKVKWPS